MKKIVSALAALLLILGTAQADTYYAFCKPDSTVNLRSAPSSASDYAGYLLCGWEFEAEESFKDNRGRVWYKSSEAMCEAGTVYVCGSYMSDSLVIVEEHHAVVTGNGRVAIRDLPGGKRVKWAKPGDRLTIQAYSADWALTAKGYISTEYLYWDD